MAKFVAPRLQPSLSNVAKNICVWVSIFWTLFHRVGQSIVSGSTRSHRVDADATSADLDMGCDLFSNSIFAGPGACFGGNGLQGSLVDSGGTISLTHLHHRHFIHPNDARALTSCLVHVLSASNLEDTLNHFPVGSLELEAFLKGIRGRSVAASS